MIAVWDHRSLAIRDDEQHILLDAIEVEQGAPSLAGIQLQAPIEALLWPLEQMLVFPFQLPLPHPRMLDEQVIGQELDEQTGEGLTDWWLSWLAAPVPDGVLGMAVGMPQAAKRRMMQDQAWRSCRFIGVDAWPRLEVRRPADALEGAVVDADDTGVFFGAFAGSDWLGMRRLNRVGSRGSEEIAADMLHSLKAMGYDATQPLYGVLDAELLAALREHGVQWQGETEQILPQRQEATLTAALRLRADKRSLGPNFRRADWAVDGNTDGGWGPWRRAAWSALALALVVLVGKAYQLHHLKQNAAMLRSGIEASFHQGLPKVSVMIDPLAQLRSAATGHGEDSELFLRHLQAVATLKAREPSLRIDKLEYADAKMNLSGTASDFAAVNRIRDLLAKALGYQVNLKDTETDGESRVRFRMQWSAS